MRRHVLGNRAGLVHHAWNYYSSGLEVVCAKSASQGHSFFSTTSYLPVDYRVRKSEPTELYAKSATIVIFLLVYIRGIQG